MTNATKILNFKFWLILINLNQPSHMASAIVLDKKPEKYTNLLFILICMPQLGLMVPSLLNILDNLFS